MLTLFQKKVKIISKTVKTVCFGVVLCVPSIRDLGAAESCSIFSDEQREVLQQSYDFGKPYDMGWSLAAIAWKESSAGLKLANFSDPSFGVYHILLKTAAAHEGVDINSDPKSGINIATRLLWDNSYAADHAITVLNYWLGRHNGDWSKAWASYNGGNNWEGNAPQEYSADIKSKLSYLRKHKCINY